VKKMVTVKRVEGRDTSGQELKGRNPWGQSLKFKVAKTPGQQLPAESEDDSLLPKACAVAVSAAVARVSRLSHSIRTGETPVPLTGVASFGDSGEFDAFTIFTCEFQNALGQYGRNRGNIEKKQKASIMFQIRNCQLSERLFLSAERRSNFLNERVL
jgi:hypothetical protein